MKHYWALKSEFQCIDGNDGFVQLSTVQLDVKDAEIYGINYVDNNGEKKGCIICHSSIGSIERWIYSILESALMKPKPELPYWLSPVQLRLIPVNDNYIAYCEKLASEFIKSRVRVDIDDRAERVGKKIRNAEMDWIPYVLVVGEEDVLRGFGDQTLALDRAAGDQVVAADDRLPRVAVIEPDAHADVVAHRAALDQAPRLGGELGAAGLPLGVEAAVVVAAEDAVAHGEIGVPAAIDADIAVVGDGAALDARTGATPTRGDAAEVAPLDVAVLHDVVIAEFAAVLVAGGGAVAESQATEGDPGGAAFD